MTPSSTAGDEPQTTTATNAQASEAPAASDASNLNAQDRPARITIPLPMLPSQLQDITAITQLTHSPSSIQPSPDALSETEVAPRTPSRSDSKPPSEPLKNRLQASQTFAEGMSSSIQSLRRKAFERMISTETRVDRQAGGGAAELPSTTAFDAPATATGVARPIMPRSRPSMTQFRARDQPAKMIIPPPYGEEKVQEAAKALAAGIPDGIPRSGTIHVPAARALSDSESSTSDEEPDVRVHFEIHLQEDADSEPICPLSEKHVATLTEELQLTPQEQKEIEGIQTKEELAAYFERIPRDYDVQIIISDHTPDSPGVTFAQDELLLNGESIAVVRRESISSSFKEKKSRRRKQKYRRPTTDLSTMPIEEPKASWLELFYDLLFVANLTEFTHSHPITGSAALAHYIGWFIIMWWAWAGQTFWAARYDMDDLFTKLWKLVEFCALISFGAFSSDHLDRTSSGFIASYIVLKAVLVIEYGNVLYWARRNRSKKSLTPLWLQIGSNLLAMLVWGLSIMVNNITWRYVMWYFTIVVEVAVLVSFGRRTSVTFAGSHLPERFALFTILVLGENIIGLIGLSAGASTWSTGQDPFLILFLLTTVILYALWWLYFDDFSEDIFHKTTTLSQLWAYLHLPLHVCIVLVGTGALDLIRLYKLEHITETIASPAHMTSAALQEPSLLVLNPIPRYVALGFEVPIERRSASAMAGSLAERDTDYDLTKQYFLVVCSLLFLCNSLLKWINLRSYDKFQKIVYLSRFLNAIFILSLLAVPLEKMTPFALLGSMAFFCVLQVVVDLAVIYFGAYGFVDDIEAWARSARSSIDLGSFLPSPLGGRSRGNSRAHSRAGSVVNLSSLGMGRNNKKRYHPNSSSTSLVNPVGVPLFHPSQANAPTSYLPQQKQTLHSHQQQPSLQRRTSVLSQQQQQALYNMHVNANSLGASGAYGNLVQALAEIKKREQWSHASGDGFPPIRQMSLSAAERGLATNFWPRGSDEGGLYVQKRSISPKRPGDGQPNTGNPVASRSSVSTGTTAAGSSPSLPSGTGSPRSVVHVDSSGSSSIGAIGLTRLFDSSPSITPK